MSHVGTTSTGKRTALNYAAGVLDGSSTTTPVPMQRRRIDSTGGQDESPLMTGSAEKSQQYRWERNVVKALLDLMMLPGEFERYVGGVKKTFHQKWAQILNDQEHFEPLTEDQIRNYVGVLRKKRDQINERMQDPDFVSLPEEVARKTLEKIHPFYSELEILFGTGGNRNNVAMLRSPSHSELRGQRSSTGFRTYLPRDQHNSQQDINISPDLEMNPDAQIGEDDEDQDDIDSQDTSAEISAIVAAAHADPTLLPPVGTETDPLANFRGVNERELAAYVSQNLTRREVARWSALKTKWKAKQTRLEVAKLEKITGKINAQNARTQSEIELHRLRMLEDKH